MNASVTAQIEKIVGPRGYLHKAEDLTLYEYDGGVDKHPPDLVVFPRTTEHVAALVKLACEFDVPFVGRGAGTGLSGGAIPRQGGMGINYGLNRVRFPAPVPVDSRLRASFEVASVDEFEGGAQVTMTATVEREGGEKPVCVAEVVFRYYG